MAINWGTKIFLLYAGFVLLIGTLVWKSMHTTVDLVSEDYYQQEVSFQQRLNAQTETMQLSHKPVVSTTPSAILIFFPQEFSGKKVRAEVRLYHPANSSLDKAFTTVVVNDGRLEIPRKNVPAVNYIAKLSWLCEGKTYYQEFPLNLSAL
jgi:hypothetical protein